MTRTRLLLPLLALAAACGRSPTELAPPSTAEAPAIAPAPAPVLHLTVECPGRLSYWQIARDDSLWDGTMVLGAFGLHAADSLAWVVDFAHVPLPRGIHRYAWTEWDGLPMSGGRATANAGEIRTDSLGRGAATIRCRP